MTILGLSLCLFTFFATSLQAGDGLNCFTSHDQNDGFEVIENFAELSSCKLSRRPKQTNIKDYCNNCIAKRDSILTRSKATQADITRFDDALLQNQGRLWSQSLDRLVSDIAFFTAEGVVNPKLSSGIKSNSCNISLLERKSSKFPVFSIIRFLRY